MKSDLARLRTHVNCPQPTDQADGASNMAFIPLEKGQREEIEGLIVSTKPEKPQTQ